MIREIRLDTGRIPPPAALSHGRDRASVRLAREKMVVGVLLNKWLKYLWSGKWLLGIRIRGIEKVRLVLSVLPWISLKTSWAKKPCLRNTIPTPITIHFTPASSFLLISEWIPHKNVTAKIFLCIYFHLTFGVIILSFSCARCYF